ncbi:MAG: FxsA family protein [Hyphomicrobiales bacterium]|nr:FxsA family protein [Hyphomicrobiales bacterium]
MMLNDQPLRRPPLLFGGFLLWTLAEIVTFVFVVHQIGLFGAILLQVLVSLIGIRLLRALGLQAGLHLRRVLERDTPADGVMLHGMLAALGALLMIVPGFVSDLVGMALSAPSLRQMLAGRLGGMPGSRTAPDMIDLAPHEWSHVEPGPWPRSNEPRDP